MFDIVYCAGYMDVVFAVSGTCAMRWGFAGSGSFAETVQSCMWCRSLENRERQYCTRGLRLCGVVLCAVVELVGAGTGFDLRIFTC